MLVGTEEINNMVYISNNGFIKMCRGDYVEFPLFINSGSKIFPCRYYLQGNPESNVYLGVMEPNEKFENSIIRKKYNSGSEFNEHGDLLIKIFPKDTENVLPGKYYYSIKIDRGNNRVDTIVPNTEFFIMD